MDADAREAETVTTGHDDSVTEWRSRLFWLAEAYQQAHESNAPDAELAELEEKMAAATGWIASLQPPGSRHR